MILLETSLVATNVQSLSASTTFNWQMALVQIMVKTDRIAAPCTRHTLF
jgi:hypothetical protein